MTRETLFQYIQRVRLEKAAFLLLANPKETVTQIALKCGFSNQASFAKAFRSRFFMSATELRTGKGLNESNMGKVFSEVVCYNKMATNKQYRKGWEFMGIPFNVQVKEVSSMNVIYVRHTGPYKKDVALFGRLFGKLFEWANSKGLIKPAETKWLTLYHDTPEITDHDKLRISVCMTVPGDADVDVDGEIGKMMIPGGKYAIGHFELDEKQYEGAWDAMFVEWLPESGYQPDDRLSFELYPDNQEEHPGGKHAVDIYVPIKPL